MSSGGGGMIPSGGPWTLLAGGGVGVGAVIGGLIGGLTAAMAAADDKAQTMMAIVTIGRARPVHGK